MLKKRIDIEPPRSILLIKLSAIGDVVHTLPLLEVLRKNFPEAKIDWLVEEEAWPMIQGHPDVDRVLVSFRKTWQKEILSPRKRLAVLKEMKDFVQALRSQHYDLVIDLHGLFKSGILTGLARGRRKIGFTGGKEGSMFFLSERPYPFDYNRHALDRYLLVARYLGCRIDPWTGEIPLFDRDRKSVNRLLKEHFVPEDSFVAINPIARWATKLWDEDRFTALAGKLQEEFPCKILFTGSPSDRPVIERIIQSINPRPLNLAGRTTLKELACLYAHCRLVVATDTGPMHIAAAMGVPVVALFGPTAPWRTGPYGKRHTVIQENLECGPCFKKKCSHLTCMKSITVEKVFDAVKQHLSKR